MKMHKDPIQKQARALQFNVAGLLRSATGAQRRHVLEVAEPSFGEDLVFAGPLRGTVVLTRTAHGVLLEAHLETSVWLTCDRCLEGFQHRLEVAWSEEFHPSVDILTGRHLPLDPDDLDEAVVIDQFHIMDLAETIRQHLLLALPIHPLCREDCAGICPVCGAVRDREPCSCQTEMPDPRWAALASLLGGEGEESS